MKIYIFIILSSLLLISCSSTKRYYFYATLDSENNKMNKTESGIFTEIKDSIKISYIYSGENINMNLNIENKAPYPISVNWDKSHLQINDMMPKMYKNIHRKDHQLEAYEIKENSNKEYVLLKDAGYNFRQINKRKASNKEKAVGDRNVKTKSLEFDSDNSPLFLTSTIYLVKNKDNTKEEYSSINTFYLSSLNRIDKKDYKKIKRESNSRGDILCIRYERERNNKFGQMLMAGLIETAFFVIDTKLNEGLDYE